MDLDRGAVAGPEHRLSQRVELLLGDALAAQDHEGAKLRFGCDPGPRHFVLPS